jgi:hypothetical protein
VDHVDPVRRKNDLVDVIEAKARAPTAFRRRDCRASPAPHLKAGASPASLRANKLRRI